MQRSRDPASIRHLNPGAAYPSRHAARFGSTGTARIGGGHLIASFDDPVNGAAYNIDLARRLYANMPLDGLIRKWSGGNSSDAYANFIAQRLGISRNATISGDMLADPKFGPELLKAKSYWESGRREFPLDNAGWQQAHARVYGGTPQQAQPQAVAARPQQPTMALGASGVTPPMTPVSAPQAPNVLAGSRWDDGTAESALPTPPRFSWPEDPTPPHQPEYPDFGFHRQTPGGQPAPAQPQTPKPNGMLATPKWQQDPYGIKWRDGSFTSLGGA